jgi:hypothetical protein
MAESDIGTVRIPVQHAGRRASLWAATWLVGKPTRTAGARSARRGAEAARQHAVALQAISATPVGGRILQQKGLRDDPPWSGSWRTLTRHVTPLPC